MNITPQQASQSLSSALFVDVRTPAEYEEMHIPGSQLHPLPSLNPEQIAKLAFEKSACILVCRSGGRARQAFEKLQSHGLPNLCVLEGGVLGWESCGLELTRGKKTISLERQVRIAAGALVVAGSALAFFVTPAFITLPVFVGAGLMFAGITDTCGLAMVLSRMPWNTRSNPKANSCGAPKSSCSL
jgi:rhodanese-related sulfurtransferase